MAKDPELFVVAEAFATNLGGAITIYRKGRIVSADDPRVKAMPGRFRPVGLTKPEVRTEAPAAAADAPRANGLARYNQLKADALALGLTPSGSADELQAAIDAKLAEGGA